MLIRTQNGMAVVDITGMTLKAKLTGDGMGGNGDYEIIAYGNNLDSDSVERLGLYPTKRRAIEVLNDICDSYQKLKEYEISGQSLQQPEFVYHMMED